MYLTLSEEASRLVVVPFPGSEAPILSALLTSDELLGSVSSRDDVERRDAILSTLLMSDEFSESGASRDDVERPDAAERLDASLGKESLKLYNSTLKYESDLHLSPCCFPDLTPPIPNIVK
jgi:hypothetical protein